ncbi:unnamed protein product [Symbiodinium natans]|uniref:C3H1-type domain-containing protein n=1 Tax=Symbiodinium natans TaxID=878477 RepID=A0A812PQD2_9DINO|nr:unnamed protein product [Symbiodinium natans]
MAHPSGSQGLAQNVAPRVSLESSSSSSMSSWVLHLQRAIQADLSDSAESAGQKNALNEGPDNDELDENESDLERPVSAGEQGQQQKIACDPCLFFFSKRGCRNGSACKYCHLDHVHSHRPAQRPRKQTRDRYKRHILQLVQDQDDLEHIQDELQEVSRKKPYMRNFLQGYLEGRASSAVNVASPAQPKSMPRLPGIQTNAPDDQSCSSCSAPSPSIPGLPPSSAASAQPADTGYQPRQDAIVQRFSL